MLFFYIGIKKDRFNLKYMRDEIFVGDVFYMVFSKKLTYNMWVFFYLFFL